MLKSYLSFALFLIGFSVALYAQQDSINTNGYNVFHYPNGVKSSEGNFKNGKPDGLWKNYYKTGELKSIGYRNAFELDSIWKFYREDGILIEEIEYDSNKRNGITKVYNEEGFLITKVNYQNDKKNGRELEYYPELKRIHFERPYLKGQLNGVGYEYAEDGREISIILFEKGFVKDEDIINRLNPSGQKAGIWIEFYEDLRFTDGEKIRKLEGRYEKGLKNGYFREYDRTGTLVNTLKYVNGQLVDDPIELQNVEIKREFHPNATVKIEKTYYNGQPHGIWKEYDVEGNLVNSWTYKYGTLLGEGIVDAAGVKQGPWKEYYPDGTLRAEGEYLDGERFKRWKFYFQNGKLEQTGKYKKGGLQDGEWKWYYSDGDPHRVENFYKGNEEGEIVEYDTNGKVILEGEYIDGLETGKWFIEMGDYREEGEFVDGNRHGEWVHTYLVNEKIAYEGNYIDGFEDGKHTWYYENGKKMLEGNYELGIKQGEWKRYNEEGLLILTITYKDNKDKRLDGTKIKIPRGKKSEEKETEEAQ
tara:strand:+ start:41859 stop:43448 length:1590 start_codon:yes stop_codon:yes gene_type:complete